MKNIIISLGMVILFSCEDGEAGKEYRGFDAKKTRISGAENKASSKNLKGKTGILEAESEEADGKIELVPLGESAFVAGPKHRDPFAPFLEVLIKKEILTERPIQREVKLKEYDITELKLIGIITNIGDPRAMVTTPDKTGFVLRRGDYVGRADFVKQKNGPPIQVNWRVARIHGAGKEEERGIYLVRDDPTSIRGDDVTRFVPLHPID